MKDKKYASKIAIYGDELYKSCPNCSADKETDVYYSEPIQTYGTAKGRCSQRNPVGIQSHCNKCRSESAEKSKYSKKIIFDEEEETSFHVIKSLIFINILEYDEENFLNYVIRRFEKIVSTKQRTNDLNKIFVVFELQRNILGYGILLNPKLNCSILYFDMDSVYLFEQIIPKDNLKINDIDYELINDAGKEDAGKEFSVGNLYWLFDYFSSKDRVQLESKIQANVFMEGKIQENSVDKFERDSKARDKCIEHYKNKNHGVLRCEICHFNFGEFYGIEFSEKIEVHHIVPLSQLRKEHVVNPIEDLLPVCPNCHFIIHSKNPPYLPEELNYILNSMKSILE